MDSFQSDFEYLCRVCAANTKGKYSVQYSECVDILKTPGLKQKVEKYLYLGISETDALPKVLCKTCFRQVEATASLSKIAKHTQKVFRDFLLSAGKQFLGINYENQPQDNFAATSSATIEQSSTTEISPLPPTKSHNNNNNNSNSRASDAVKCSNLTLADVFVPPVLMPLTPHIKEAIRREEVVLNVSVSDPLTRDTQQKMISASQKRQSNALRTVGGHAETGFTPRSIAQRAFSPRPTASEGNLHKTTPSARSGANRMSKKYSPPGVINFFHNRSLTAPTISTTLTSNKSQDNNKQKQQQQQQLHIPSVINNNETTITKTTTDEALLPISNTAQQLYHKRKQTKMSTAVNQQNQQSQMQLKPQQQQQQRSSSSSSKATKQISLLKVSQQKQQEKLQQQSLLSSIRTTTTAAAAAATRTTSPPASKVGESVAATTTIITVKSHESLTRITNKQYEQEDEEQLPQRMIIAAAKSEKQQKQQHQQKPIKSTKTVIVPIATEITQKINNNNNNDHSNINVETTQQKSLPQQQQQQQHEKSTQPQQLLPTTTTTLSTTLFGTSTNFDDNILLGKVIRDVDLLKLIIKALQWPVNDKTMDVNLMRLRNSKFLEVMSDHNLLQDTDLTQILGPIIFAAQHLQQQQQNELQQKQNELKQRQELQNQFEQQLKQKQQQQQQQQQLIVAEKQQQKQQQKQLILAEKQQQQQQLEQEQQLAMKYKNKMENNNGNVNVNNMKTQVMDLATSLTYKLPAETSVQLVPASPEIEEAQSSASSCSGNNSINNDFKNDNNNVRIMPIKKQKRKIEQLLSHPVIIAVDDDDDHDHDDNSNNDNDNDATNKNVKTKRRTNKSTKNKIIFDDNVNNLNNSDDSIFDTDDIVLMEDQPHLETIKSLVNSGVIVEATPSIGSRSPNKHVTFAEPLTPPITRPIIKRRKTVIHATKPLPASIVKKQFLTNETIATASDQNDNKEEHIELVANAVTAAILENDAAEIIENIVNTKVLPNTSIQLSIATQVPSDMELPSVEHAPKVILTAVPSDIINPTTSAKSQNNLGSGANNKRDQKFALGQQLLQAIGLKQPTAECIIGGKEKKTDSVAQIRSALKRSLKQAQEQQQKQQQQQQRNNAKEEPIIQDADSTTRNNKQGVALAEAAAEQEDKLLTKTVKRKNSTSPQDEVNNKIATTQNMQKKNDLNKSTSVVIDISDVTSTAENVVGRKRGRKSKSEIRDIKLTKTEQSEDDDVRSDFAIESLSNRRPTRMSKTLSKYYKGPEQNTDSRRSLPARSTRNSK